MNSITITPRGQGTQNMFLGQDAGNLNLSGVNNVAYGANALNDVTSGSSNTAIGVSALTVLTTATSNVAVGGNAGDSITTGSFNVLVGLGAGDTISTSASNVAVGYNALGGVSTGDGRNISIGINSAGGLSTGTDNIIIGSSAAIIYQGVESSNIIIGNRGVVAENNTIRIGAASPASVIQNRAFIAGIRGVSVTGGQQVVIDASGQLGTSPASGLIENYRATAISTGILVTDVIVGVTSTAAPRTLTMPNAALITGQRWTFKDESGGAAANNITISGNGLNIDGAATFVMNTNYGSVDIYYSGSNFFIV